MTYRNLLIVFVATGLWHGAAWTFLCWGLFHGAFLVLERLLFRAPIEALRSGFLRYVYCLPVVLFGWVLFRADSLTQAVEHWSAMVWPFEPISFALLSERTSITPYSLAALMIGALLFFLPGDVSFGRKLADLSIKRSWPAFDLAYTVAALALSGVLVLAGKYSPFLYFRF